MGVAVGWGVTVGAGDGVGAGVDVGGIVIGMGVARGTMGVGVGCGVAVGIGVDVGIGVTRVNGVAVGWLARISSTLWSMMRAISSFVGPQASKNVSSVTRPASLGCVQNTLSLLPSDDLDIIRQTKYTNISVIEELHVRFNFLAIKNPREIVYSTTHLGWASSQSRVFASSIHSSRSKTAFCAVLATRLPADKYT